MEMYYLDLRHRLLPSKHFELSSLQKRSPIGFTFTTMEGLGTRLHTVESKLELTKAKL